MYLWSCSVCVLKNHHVRQSYPGSNTGVAAGGGSVPVLGSRLWIVKWEPHRNIRICGSYSCNSSGVQTPTWSPRLSEEACGDGSALLLDMNNQSFEATRKVVRGVAHSCTWQHLMWVWEACIWWVPGPPSSARFILCFHHCLLQKTANTKFKLSLNFTGIRASTRFQNKCWSRADYILQDCLGEMRPSWGTLVSSSCWLAHDG